jgi:N-acetylglucosamine-6-sulfatase
MRRVYEGIVVIALLLAVGLLPAQPEASLAQAQARPNILFILTDDQDAGSIQYMPRVRAQLAEKGTTFKNGILTLTQCCPSRATMLRGQYAHNHTVGLGGRSNARYFRRRGLEGSTVATWLDGAGYRTALVGKYLNGYDYRYVPSGWDRWYANVGKDVWPECLNENGKERCYGGRHPDVVLAEKAERFVRSSKGNPAPLFLWLSFNTPHEENNRPPPYMRQDRNKFSHVPLPKPPSFDEVDVSDKPAWVRKMPRLSPKSERHLRAHYRDRLRSLQTADRAVARLLDALADTGRLKNSYIVYFTDNGFHMGQHRLPAGKSTPYVEDTRFSLIVQGPGVPQGQTRQELILNTDLAPTFAELGGAGVPNFVDGRSFAPLLRGESSPWRTAALIENRRSKHPHRPAYAGLITQDTAYVEYDSGAREYYNLDTDPYQTENIYQNTKATNPKLIMDLEARLDALRSCKADGCRTAENAP